MQTNSTTPYRSTKKLSAALTGLLSALAVFDAFNTLFTLGQLYLPYQVELDPATSVSVWEMAAGIAGVLQFPALILTIVLFLIWLNWSYKNLTPLGAKDLRYSSGWAVGYWFIPFVQLVRPFQVVREVWNQSSPELDPRGNFSPSPGTPQLLIFWWALWPLSNVVANLSVQMTLAEKKEEEPAATAIFGMASILSMFAAIALAMVVGGITRRQTERSEKIESTYINSESPLPSAIDANDPD